MREWIPRAEHPKPVSMPVGLCFRAACYLLLSCLRICSCGRAPELCNKPIITVRMMGATGSNPRAWRTLIDSCAVWPDVRRPFKRDPSSATLQAVVQFGTARFLAAPQCAVSIAAFGGGMPIACRMHAWLQVTCSKYPQAVRAIAFYAIEKTFHCTTVMGNDSSMMMYGQFGGGVRKRVARSFRLK